MSDPTWQDGEPTNPEAALLDAVEWLEFLDHQFARVCPVRLVDENRRRLKQCIAAARSFVVAEKAEAANV